MLVSAQYRAETACISNESRNECWYQQEGLVKCWYQQNHVISLSHTYHACALNLCVWVSQNAAYEINMRHMPESSIWNLLGTPATVSVACDLQIIFVWWYHWLENSISAHRNWECHNWVMMTYCLTLIITTTLPYCWSH